MDDPDFDAQLVNQMAAQQLNLPPDPASQPAIDPAQLPPGAQQQMPPGQPPAPAKPPEAATTPQEQATSELAPKADGGKKSDPFDFFEVETRPGEKKAYTPDQLRGIAARYSDLNFKHQNEVAPNQKSIALLNTIRAEAAKQGIEITDDMLSSTVQSALSALAHNPTLGAQSFPTQQPPTVGREDVAVQSKLPPVNPNDMAAQLAQWEEQNAITLPPMYRDAMMKTGQLEGRINELTQLLQQVAGQGLQATTAAQEQVAIVQDQSRQAMNQKLANNLNRIQVQHQFPDEAEKDFMSFVQARGYDITELMDYNLANTLATDFKAVQQGPELQRLRDLAARRQSFTGNTSPAPGQSPLGSPAPDADASFINEMADQALRAKNKI